MAEDEPLFPRDHNQVDMPAEARAAIRLELEPLTARRDEIARKAAAFVQVRDRIDLQAATDIVGVGKEIGGMVEAARKETSGPYYDSFRAVNDFAGAFWQPAGDAIAALEARMEEFNKAEDARIAKQQDEQRRHEESLRAAAGGGDEIAGAPPVERPAAGPSAPAPAARPVRGDWGYAARRRGVDIIEVTDWRLLPDWVFESRPVLEAIIATVKPNVSRSITVSGIKVTKDTKTRVGR